MSRELSKELDKEWEDCWECKIFNLIDKTMTKIAPYVLAFAIIYFGVHLIISLL